MAPVKLKYIVTFTSQDDNHRANNLIAGDGIKKWLCHPKDRTGKIEIVIQLEEATQLSFIDIGTIWCANLEIRVGKSDWPQAAEYKTLVPLVTLMSPIDCQLGRKISNTQMFSHRDFSEASANQKWDRIQILGRQPYKKDMQMGVSFLRLRSSTPSTPNAGNFGSLSNQNKRSPKGITSKEIQRHFFGDSKENNSADDLKHKLLQISNSSDSGCDNIHQQALSRTAKLVISASEKTSQTSAHYKQKSSGQGFFSDTVISKNKMTVEEEMTAFFPSLNLSAKDLDKITIADLRHKFERLQRRKLSLEEKKIFSGKCHEFIWSLTEPDCAENNRPIANPLRNVETASASATTSLTSPKTTRSGNQVGHSSSNSVLSPHASAKPTAITPVSKRTVIKMSPAAVLRKQNAVAVNKECDEIIISKNKTSETDISSNHSNTDLNSSASDICYDSSSSSGEEEDNGKKDRSPEIDDSSPTRSPKIKRQLQTLENVNRSYQDLYKTFAPFEPCTPSQRTKQSCSASTSKKSLESCTSVSPQPSKQSDSTSKKSLEPCTSVSPQPSKQSDSTSTSKKTKSCTLSSSHLSMPSSSTSISTSTAPKQSSCLGGASTSTSASRKRKRMNKKSQEIISLLDSELSDSDNTDRVATANQTSKPWISACKNSPKTSTPNPKPKIFKNINKASNGSSASQHQSQSRSPPSTPTMSRSHVATMSIQCKACKFFIPRDTYQAHQQACSSSTSQCSTASGRPVLSLKGGGPPTAVVGFTNNNRPGTAGTTSQTYSKCPICMKTFPQDILLVHASDCGL